jgi:hypothetical protein
MISKDPCADFRGCLRVVRLHAPPDAKVISMRVDLEQDGKLQVRQEFKWNRLPPQQAGAAAPASGSATPQGRGDAAGVSVPTDIATWLGKLIGQFRIPAVGDAASCRAMRTIQAELSGRAATDPVAACPKSENGKAEVKRRPPDAECQGIGAGPGVRCVIYMDWPEKRVPVRWKWYQTLNSTFLMFGFDPATGGIAQIHVGPGSDVGPAWYATGLLKEGKLAYRPDCSRPPCSSIEQMTIARNGERVLWQVFRGPGEAAFSSWRMDRIREEEASTDGNTSPPQPRRPDHSPRRQ